MTYDFHLPDIGEGISEASLIEWVVAVGDTVEEGDDVAIISTDKADVELASPRKGTIAELRWSPGDLIAVGDVLLRFQGAEAAKAPLTVAPGPGVDPDVKSSTKPDNNVIVAAPSTRKLASEVGVDLGALVGSGPNGEITRADVAAATTSGDTTETLDPVRLAMAARMTQSLRNNAHSGMDFQVDGSALLSLHRRLDAARDLAGEKVSLTALLAKCVAAALIRNPRLNSTINPEGTTLTLHGKVDLGVALASARGLLVPVLRDVGSKTGLTIARDLADLTTRGRDGTLRAEEMRGGSFTLSNTGSLERALFTSTSPIINPPQTAILWLSRLCDRVWAKDGQAVIRPVLSASISFDHRCLDGADIVGFVNDFSGFVEAPEVAILQ